ncbi:HNH endonuclease [Thiogranum longum]|uniref:HNH endonuclease n=1 Tax=Thiogranum longum TaxID=1537524 RepID=A0A4R1HH70_9GAMM|nr:HNH endonuclease [Thiogranum longum]TCK18719.1 HNH endonuclease [Thiogranum longum]
MNFENWLDQIGLSKRTADSYSGALSRTISGWAIEAKLIKRPLTSIQSAQKFRDVAEQIKALTIFQEKNVKGKGMYSAALNQYEAYLDDTSGETIQEDIEDVLSNDSLEKTEKLTQINARVGQGKFRQQLIDQWKGCALTGFSDTRFLVASHIKPWRASDNQERLDCFNGLLLLPNLDKVFDLGFITFMECGGIKISEMLENKPLLGISADMHIELGDAHQAYMAFHREYVFEKRYGG